MSSCKLDHPVEDVQQKLLSQKDFLPEELFQATTRLLETDLSQAMLNEVFHLLKKYDLADTEEQQQRNMKLSEITANV